VLKTGFLEFVIAIFNGNILPNPKVLRRRCYVFQELEEGGMAASFAQDSWNYFR